MLSKLEFKCVVKYSNGALYDGAIANEIKKIEGYNDTSDFEVNVIICKSTDFRDRKLILMLNKDNIRNYYDIQTSKLDEYNPKPIILVGLEDLFNENIQEQFNLDNRFRFWDSNIWQRYVCFDENFREKFLSIVNLFHTNTKSRNKDLYATTVAKEFLEFQTRIYVNSFLSPINNGGGHATDVTPFKFHSETKMNHEAEKLSENFKKTINKNKYKWRVLIVDDFADKPLKVSENIRNKIKEELNKFLSKIEKDEFDIDKLLTISKTKLMQATQIIPDQNKKVDQTLLKNSEVDRFLVAHRDKIDVILKLLPPTKKEIIKSVLNNFDNFVIVTHSSVKEFIEYYSSNNSNVNDIILLDYLLDSKEDGQREYSTDILKWIKGDLIFYKEIYRDKKEKIKSCLPDEFSKIKEDIAEKGIAIQKLELKDRLQGPLNQFWFFPTSVFSYAFMEDIRQMGYTQFEDEWVIARGADPLNTPELFKYSLFKFMEAQISETKLLNDDKTDFMEPINQLLREIFFNPQREEIQKKAQTKFAKFTLLRANYETLNKDAGEKEGKGSLFANSFLKLLRSNNKSNAIINSLDHIQHLLFLVAFHSAYDWPQMREEYNRIEFEFKKCGISFLGVVWEDIYSFIDNCREQVEMG